jgi:hypothetical protein
LWRVLFWTQEYLPLTRREAQLLIKLLCCILTTCIFFLHFYSLSFSKATSISIQDVMSMPAHDWRSSGGKLALGVFHRSLEHAGEKERAA